MSAHFNEIQGTILFYSNGKSFEQKSEYVCSAAFFRLSPQVTYIYNITGKMTSDYYRDVIAQLIEKGCKKILGYFPTSYLPLGFTPVPKSDLHEMELDVRSNG